MIQNICLTLCPRLQLRCEKNFIRFQRGKNIYLVMDNAGHPMKRQADICNRFE